MGRGEEENEEKEKELGLGEQWEDVERALEDIIPVYDRTNRYISLRRDISLRVEGIQMLLRSMKDDPFSILDLGSGPGKMSEILYDLEGKSSNARQRRIGLLVMVDALRPMASLAKNRLRHQDPQAVVSIYESLPIRDNSFDAAMAGFALRDAKNLRQALSELRRILRRGGKFLIVDLSKPDSSIRRKLVGLYWLVFVPLIALAVSGRRGLKFSALSTTYKSLPRNSDFLKTIRDCGFEISQQRSYMVGGANILLLSNE